MFGRPLRFKVIVLLMGLLVAFSLAGCQRSAGTLSGKVTYQNKQLKYASVSFVSTDGGRSYASDLREDGTYYIPDMHSGQYKVCVDTSHLKGNAGADPLGGARPAGKDPASATQAANLKKYVPIPEKYATPEKTDLTYTHTGSETTWDIELK